MNKDIITVALAKGRLAEKAVEVFEKSGVKCKHILEPSRKLIFSDESGLYNFIMVKPSDVPTYVEYGVADIGVCGKDTLMENGKDIYEMLDLVFGACRLCIAGFADSELPLTSPNLRVATKFTNIAKQLFMSRGVNVEIIKLNGSIELAPLLSLSDVILDIVESGKTLLENNLIIKETICNISARLVVNKSSLKIKQGIKQLVEKMRDVLKEGV